MEKGAELVAPVSEVSTCEEQEARVLRARG